MKCPICSESAGPDAPLLDVFFEIEQVPVFCNVLHASPEQAHCAARGDIRLGSCSACGMIHNVAFDPALVEYAEGYENSLHCSSRFQSFAEELADATGYPTCWHRPTLGHARACHGQRGPPGGTRKAIRAAEKSAF